MLSSDVHLTTLPILGMKKWQGRVVEVFDAMFTAEMASLDEEGAVLLADFNTDLLAPDDDDLCVGDIVYLTVRTIQEGKFFL